MFKSKKSFGKQVIRYSFKVASMKTCVHQRSQASFAARLGIESRPSVTPRLHLKKRVSHSDAIWARHGVQGYKRDAPNTPLQSAKSHLVRALSPPAATRCFTHKKIIPAKPAENRTSQPRDIDLYLRSSYPEQPAKMPREIADIKKVSCPWMAGLPAGTICDRRF